MISNFDDDVIAVAEKLGMTEAELIVCCAVINHIQKHLGKLNHPKNEAEHLANEVCLNDDADITAEDFERQMAIEEEMSYLGRARFLSGINNAQLCGREDGTVYGRKTIKYYCDVLAERLDEEYEKVISDRSKNRKLNVLFNMMYKHEVDSRLLVYIALSNILSKVLVGKTFSSIAQSIGDDICTELTFKKLKSNEDKSRYYSCMLADLRKENNKDRLKVTIERYKKIAFGEEGEEFSHSLKVNIGTCLILFVEDNTDIIEIVDIFDDTSKRVKYIRASESFLSFINKEVSRNEYLSPAYKPCVVPPKKWTNVIDGGYYTQGFKGVKLFDDFNRGVFENRVKNHDSYGEVIEAVNNLQNTACVVDSRVLELAKSLWASGGGMLGLPKRDDYPLPVCPFCGKAFGMVEGKRIRRRDECIKVLLENVERVRIKKKRSTIARPLDYITGELKADYIKFLKWKESCAVVYSMNASRAGKVILTEEILGLAEEYANDVFWFPYRADFRTRLYPYVSGLSPQGNDLAKALVSFGKKYAVESEQQAKYIASQVAKTYGKDKIDLDGRYNWVKENEEKILDVALNPRNNIVFIESADKPFQFYRSCLEWAGWVKEGIGFKTNLPIQFDGTCNVYQHFSAISRDENIGKEVNMVDSKSIGDIYNLVSDKVALRLKDKAKNGVKVYSKDKKFLYDEKASAKFVLKSGIMTRKMFKRQTMVIPYNGKYESIIDYTHEYLRDCFFGESPKFEYKFDDKSKYSEILFMLSKIIWEEINSLCNGVKQVMTFLENVANAYVIAGKNPCWKTGTGAYVEQCYFESATSRLNLYFLGKEMRISTSEQSKNRSISKNGNAIAPNFIHSFDASALVKTVNALFSETDCRSFFSIHDCYSTDATHCEDLEKILRREFVKLYEGNVLDDLLDFARTQIGSDEVKIEKSRVKYETVNELETVKIAGKEYYVGSACDFLPANNLKYGSLKIDKVKKSRFFFS